LALRDLWTETSIASENVNNIHLRVKKFCFTMDRQGQRLTSYCSLTAILVVLRAFPVISHSLLLSINRYKSGIIENKTFNFISLILSTV
jgi:hypothetical protein